MGIVLNQKKRICRIANTCVLPELHCITGPVNRAKLTTDQIVKLVHNGRTVYELDPAGKLPEIKLNTVNCFESPFKTNGTKETPVVEIPKETKQQVAPTPVVEKVEEKPAEPVKEEVPVRQEYNKWDKKNKHKNNKYSVESHKVEDRNETPTEESIVKEDL